MLWHWNPQNHWHHIPSQLLVAKLTQTEHCFIWQLLIFCSASLPPAAHDNWIASHCLLVASNSEAVWHPVEHVWCICIHLSSFFAHRMSHIGTRQHGVQVIDSCQLGRTRCGELVNHLRSTQVPSHFRTCKLKLRAHWVLTIFSWRRNWGGTRCHSVPCLLPTDLCGFISSFAALCHPLQGGEGEFHAQRSRLNQLLSADGWILKSKTSSHGPSLTSECERVASNAKVTRNSLIARMTWKHLWFHWLACIWNVKQPVGRPCCQPRGQCASVDDHGASSECKPLIHCSHNLHSLSNCTVDLARSSWPWACASCASRLWAPTVLLCLLQSVYTVHVLQERCGISR